MNIGGSGTENDPVNVETDEPDIGSNEQVPICVDIPEPIINLPLSVKIITGCDNPVINCWNLANRVFPYINRIWYQAGINFFLKSCMLVRPIPGINSIDEDFDERDFDRRFLTDQAALNIFIKDELHDPFCLGLTRSLGEYQDEYDGMSYILMRQAGGAGLLRFANTLAHELGHYLNLIDNDTEGTLMYGYTENTEIVAYQDRVLQPNEITIARAMAEILPVPWDFTLENELTIVD